MAELPAKKVKMHGGSEAPCKGAPSTLASENAPLSEVPREEGSSRQKDKATSRSRSMTDVCRVWAHSQNEFFLAQEIANLPKLFGESSLKARWATLTLPKQCVYDSKRVIDELSRLISELRAKVCVVADGFSLSLARKLNSNSLASWSKGDPPRELSPRSSLTSETPSDLRLVRTCYDRLRNASDEMTKCTTPLMREERPRSLNNLKYLLDVSDGTVPSRGGGKGVCPVWPWAGSRVHKNVNPRFRVTIGSSRAVELHDPHNRCPAKLEQVITSLFLLFGVSCTKAKVGARSLSTHSSDD
ncbi:hypothetical protein BHE74_00033516 [Ensete ventricosum]|nr:hypothetical protein BHE74_00033516 [Ensete ventricosum]